MFQCLNRREQGSNMWKEEIRAAQDKVFQCLNRREQGSNEARTTYGFLLDGVSMPQSA